MLATEITLGILLGALLAVPYCLYARSAGRPGRVFGSGLVVAASVYVGFALAHGEGRPLLVELAGVALFCALATAGVRWPPYWLALGWLAHVAWDLALHPIETSGYAPWWYPVLCIGFDILVAGFILADGAARAVPVRDGRSP